VGCAFSEPDGVVAGRARAGAPLEVSFETPSDHDRGWSRLLRQRAANRYDSDLVTRFDFASDAADGAPRGRCPRRQLKIAGCARREACWKPCP
jgi:hypothetical protein